MSVAEPQMLATKPFMKTIGCEDATALYDRFLKPLEERFGPSVPADYFEAALDLCAMQVQAVQRRFADAGLSSALVNVYIRTVFDELKAKVGVAHGIRL